MVMLHTAGPSVKRGYLVGMSKRHVTKAIKQFYGGEPPPEDQEHKGLVFNEEQFIQYAKAKCMRPILRNGWPDFILFDSLGHPFFVEVKAGRKDTLRASQKKTFAVLEKLGAKVYIWSQETKGVLVPWRRW